FGSGDVGVRVIGVGFDGTPASRVALEVATDMALAGGAALRVFTVARKHAALPGAAAEPGQGAGAPSETEYLRGQLHEAVTELPPEVRALPVFLRGFAADELVSAAKLGVDLLVLGSRRGGPLRRAAHHSVTSFVVNEAPCPVLVCPSGVPAPRPALA
ncbi:MAG: universal stress protein, partial [Solirubrobacterales bacterium]